MNSHEKQDLLPAEKKAKGHQIKHIKQDNIMFCAWNIAMLAS